MEGVGDLYRIYAVCKRDKIDFNLASIPADYIFKADEAFDPVEMTRLLNRAYEMAAKGYPWEKLPPRYEHRAKAPVTPPPAK